MKLSAFNWEDKIDASNLAFKLIQQPGGKKAAIKSYTDLIQLRRPQLNEFPFYADDIAWYELIIHYINKHCK